jgi:NlpC/P60 family putative phage cell wall peptidase
MATEDACALTLRQAQGEESKNVLMLSPSKHEAAALIAAARGWIGTPWRHQASLRGAGCDCLGLLRGVWREVRGTEPEALPPYAPDWMAAGRETLRDGLARHLCAVPLAALAPGDVALLRMGRGPASHCGLVAEAAGRLTLIHARQGGAVREEEFSPAWRRRLAWVFRA